MWFVAQSVEHLAVDEAVVGSNPIDPPRSSLESQVMSRELKNFLAVGLKTPNSRLMTPPDV